MGNRPKIVIVDDDPFVLETVSALLEDAGFDVIARSTAFGTSQLVMTKRPDAVLLDVDMPGLGGADLVRLLSELPKIRVALILFSALDRRELAALANDCGACGFIEKTSAPSKIVEQLHLLLSRYSRRTSGFVTSPTVPFPNVTKKIAKR
jgi:two-component system, NtrC family, nitrogen regulation response regulator NtrX